MAKINSNRPIIRLNINYINIPIKRQRLTEKMKKKKAQLSAAYKKLT